MGCGGAISTLPGNTIFRWISRLIPRYITLFMSVYPEQHRRFGDVRKAAQAFVRNELRPLRERMKEANKWLGEEVIKFAPYELPAGE